MSFDRLITKIEQTGNPTVAGLDPDFEKLPEFLQQEALRHYGPTFEAAAAAILEFNRSIIDALCDIVPAVKPQSAYYEKYGWQGVRALYQTIDYAKSRGLFVILDGKRNDIGSTMQAYADAYLGTTPLGGGQLAAFGADALTVNGYLGRDGILPALEACEKGDKGIFVLVKTSNPSSGDLQDIDVGGKTISEHMGLLCEQLGEKTRTAYGYSACGAVVGATYPAQLTALRKELPHTFFLVPGYGAQGGGAKDIAGAFDEKGRGAVINSSRAILYAWKKAGLHEREYARAARMEALHMKKEISAILP